MYNYDPQLPYQPQYTGQSVTAKKMPVLFVLFNLFMDFTTVGLWIPIHIMFANRYKNHQTITYRY